MPAEDVLFDGILSSLVDNVALESEWLDLLSQLEYVGCRKIIKSVPFDQINLSVLRHMSEEASHAYLLKSVVGLDKETWAGSRLSAVGWEYFQTLDHRISALLTDKEVCYPAVSWAVEQRVLWVYPQYEHKTRNPRVRSVVSRILAQEKRHGSQFDDLPFSQEFRRSVLAVEQEQWVRFRDSLQTFLNESTPCLSTSSA